MKKKSVLVWIYWELILINLQFRKVYQSYDVTTTFFPLDFIKCVNLEAINTSEP